MVLPVQLTHFSVSACEKKIQLSLPNDLLCAFFYDLPLIDFGFVLLLFLIMIMLNKGLFYSILFIIIIPTAKI